MDRCLVSIDLQWINWAATHDSVNLKGTFGLDTRGNAAADQTIDSISLPFGWDNQWVFAVGIQYQISDAFAVCAGLNHAKAPADEAGVFNNLAFPAVVEDDVTLGATCRFGDHWEMSGAYRRALQNELTGRNNMPAPFQPLAGTSNNAKISTNQHSVAVQISYRF